jgi:formamidopyrimidine-DNA glycosylase
MPEGPEVKRNGESMKDFINATIQSITTVSGRYTRKLIENTDIPVGQKIVDIFVKGKLIVIKLDTHAILSTLGMSGHWYYEVPDSKKKFIRIKIITNIGAMYFCDMRNFGTFKVVTHAEMYKKLDSLGADILASPDAPIHFFTRIAKLGKDKYISEVLMDQRILSGVGNYLRADILFELGIHPKKLTSSFNKGELIDIWKKCHELASESYKDGGYGYEFRVYAKSMVDNHWVESYEDNNKRMVWWSPHHQQRI